MTKSQRFFCGLGKFYAVAVAICGVIAVVDAVQTNRAIAKLKSDPFADEVSSQTLIDEATKIPIDFQLGAAFKR